MDYFNYKNGALWAEDVPLSQIAKEVGTPAYVYSAATLRRHYQIFAEALSGLPHLICYAVKACSNQAVLTLLGQMGAGMDVVSEGEYRRAKAAGVPGERIVFSGVGKTRREIETALAGGVRQFNVESVPELELLSELASQAGKTAPIALRVNPDIDAGTHAKISTGKSENKFGIPISQASEVYARASMLPGIEVVGVDVHIGSQLTELAPFEAAFTRIAELTKSLRADGHQISRIDLGGGLGIPYAQSNDAPPLPFDYGKLIARTVGDLGCEIVIEPGRLIVGNAGILLASVLYVKEGEGRDFIILDAAMNDLIRPAMYEAHHDLVPLIEPAADAPVAAFDIVGPVCETGDTFARNRMLAPVKAGDVMAFRSAGAYAAAMASEYNSRPLVPEVMVDDGQFAVIRPRPSYEEMIGRDILPAWLTE